MEIVSKHDERVPLVLGNKRGCF